MRLYIFFTFVGLLFCINMNAQIAIKTAYLPSSKYHDENKNKNGGKGDMKIIEGEAQIPISVKSDNKDRMKAWAIGLGGSYASMNNKYLSEDLYLKEMLNAEIGIIHMRPISDKWSIMGILGVGWYTSDLNHISGKSILGQGNILFIKHARSNLDWGVGIALNNVLGYPMVFPSFYFDWKLEKRYKVNISMYNSFELSASMQMTDYLNLGIIAEANGLSAAVKKDGKDMIYTNKYAYTGIQTEFKLGQSLYVPIVIGVAFDHEVYFTKRTIKAFLEDKEDYPGYSTAPYFSVGLKYGF